MRQNKKRTPEDSDKSEAVMEERIRREIELIDQYIFQAAREMHLEACREQKIVRKPK